MISEFDNRYVRYEYHGSQHTLVQKWFYTGHKNALHLLPHFNEVLDLQKAYQAQHLVFDFRHFVYCIPSDLIYSLRMDFIPRLQKLKIQSTKLIPNRDLVIRMQLEHLFARCTHLKIQPLKIQEYPTAHKQEQLMMI